MFIFNTYQFPVLAAPPPRHNAITDIFLCPRLRESVRYLTGSTVQLSMSSFCLSRGLFIVHFWYNGWCSFITITNVCHKYSSIKHLGTVLLGVGSRVQRQQHNNILRRWCVKRSDALRSMTYHTFVVKQASIDEYILYCTHTLQHRKEDQTEAESIVIS